MYFYIISNSADAVIQSETLLSPTQLKDILFDCLFICAQNNSKRCEYWTDWDEIFRVNSYWANLEMSKFWTHQLPEEILLPTTQPGMTMQKHLRI